MTESEAIREVLLRFLIAKIADDIADEAIEAAKAYVEVEELRRMAELT